MHTTSRLYAVNAGNFWPKIAPSAFEATSCWPYCECFMKDARGRGGEVVAALFTLVLRGWMRGCKPGESPPSLNLMDGPVPSMADVEVLTTTSISWTVGSERSAGPRATRPPGHPAQFCVDANTPRNIVANISQLPPSVPPPPVAGSARHRDRVWP